MTKMNNPKFTTPSGDTAPRQVWQQTVDAVLAQTKSQAAGLSSADAAERLNTCGPNALPEKKGKPGWLRFLAHFNDVLIYVLLAAAALTAIMGHWVDTLVILGVTVINAPDRSYPGEQRRKIAAGDPQHALQRCPRPA